MTPDEFMQTDKGREMRALIMAVCNDNTDAVSFSGRRLRPELLGTEWIEYSLKTKKGDYQFRETQNGLRLLDAKFRTEAGE
jgi:hypothetical protein